MEVLVKQAAVAIEEVEQVATLGGAGVGDSGDNQPWYHKYPSTAGFYGWPFAPCNPPRSTQHMHAALRIEPALSKPQLAAAAQQMRASSLKPLVGCQASPHEEFCTALRYLTWPSEKKPIVDDHILTVDVDLDKDAAGKRDAGAMAEKCAKKVRLSAGGSQGGKKGKKVEDFDWLNVMEANGY